MKPIRVLVVDDHAVVREGIAALISTEPGMTLVGKACDGVEAVEQAQRLQPDIILMDLVMPRQDGLAAIREIRAAHLAAPILVLTCFAQESQVLAALRAGAQGYVLKEISAPELLQAIRDVYHGNAVLHPKVARQVVQQLQHPEAPQDALSEREIEVLKWVAHGCPDQEIAGRLALSERTVRNHVGAILAKLRLQNRTQAAVYAWRHNLATMGKECGDVNDDVFDL